MIKRTVLITGGSSGIGKALVNTFSTAGYRVWFTYNSGLGRANELVSELAEFDVKAFEFNLGDRSSHAQLIKSLPSSVDILINNAGIGTKTVEKIDPDPLTQDELMMRVNSLGPLWLTNDLLPLMKKNGYGKIIFISSVGGGVTHFPGFRLSDGMSKAAVAHLGRQMAAELSFEPIDVFTLCPGATDTPMFRASTLNHLSDVEQVNLCKSLPAHRMITPEEIAQTCLFLCTDAARCLRGAVLDASLGLGTHPGALTGKFLEVG